MAKGVDSVLRFQTRMDEDILMKFLLIVQSIWKLGNERLAEKTNQLKTYLKECLQSIAEMKDKLLCFEMGLEAWAKK